VGNGGSSFHSEGITSFGPLPAEEIAEILSQTSSLIVPSLAENSPLVIAEAAAQGTMSIVHDVGGMPDLIRLVQSGIVFSDNKQLLKGMLSVASNNELFSSSSRRALASRALSLFSPASVSQQYDELYSP
jgi:glycosyltransferase involved in cell wall biosynthesis